MTHSVTIRTAAQMVATLARAQEWMLRRFADGKAVVLTVGEEKRSLPQNALMWALLDDVSRQVEWHGQKLTPEDWKHIFSASLQKQRAVPGLDGGFVVLGQSTSRMTTAQMSELVELIQAFGADRGVKWTDGG